MRGKLNKQIYSHLVQVLAGRFWGCNNVKKMANRYPFIDEPLSDGEQKEMRALRYNGARFMEKIILYKGFSSGYWYQLPYSKALLHQN